MPTELSALSLIACALYGAVSIACVRAGLEARANRQHGWHVKTWGWATALFVLLIISRLLGLEDIVREGLRGWLQTENLVEGRRAIQGPIIAAVIVLFASLGMFAVYWVSQRISGRRNVAVAVVWGACGVMIATIAMRTVSLHALDRLLNGPLKLNWVGDMGASFAVLGAAIFYIAIVSGRIGRKG